MSDPGFARPDLSSITTTHQAELADRVRGLLSADSYPLAVSNPLAPLARDVARTLVEVAFAMHDCHRYDLLCWLGGVCLMPIPGGPSGTSPSGMAVARITHDLLLDWYWRATYSHTCPLMNAVPRCVLRPFGDLNRQCGSGGKHLVTSNRVQRKEAGR